MNEAVFKYVMKNGFLYELSSKIIFIRNEDKTHNRTTTPSSTKPSVHFLDCDLIDPVMLLLIVLYVYCLTLEGYQTANGSLLNGNRYASHLLLSI